MHSSRFISRTRSSVTYYERELQNNSSISIVSECHSYRRTEDGKWKKEKEDVIIGWMNPSVYTLIWTFFFLSHANLFRSSHIIEMLCMLVNEQRKALSFSLYAALFLFLFLFFLFALVENSTHAVCIRLNVCVDILIKKIANSRDSYP